jgi:DNA invertase Pin-like site-specific DNA recombinase
MAKYGYARVSTGDQHPEAQHERLRAAGVPEENIHTDHGVSGTLASRPEWDKLLARLQDGDELVCVRLDRIGRSAVNLLEVAERLRDCGASLTLLDQGISTTGAMGKMFYTILAAFAEFERNLIVERTLDGQAAVRLSGNLRRSLGGLPVLGFAADPDADPETGDWKIDREQAGWLADAARRVLAGEPVEAAHAAMPPMRDSAGRKVTAKMLRAALQRPASAGLIDTGSGVMIDVPGGGPLDRRTYDRLDVLFGLRKRGGRPAETGRFPFATVLACAKCGNQLTGEARTYRGRSRDYYRCKNPHAGVPKPCHGCSVPADDVHELFGEWFEANADSPEFLMRMDLPEPDASGPLADAEARITDLEGQIEELAGNRLDGSLSAAAYNRLLGKAKGLLKDARDEWAALNLAADKAPWDVPWTGSPAARWAGMTGDQRLAVVRDMLQTPIMVRPGNGGPAALTAYDRITLTEQP